MDLYVWKHPFTSDEDEAQRLITLEDESVFGPSAELEQFYAELMELFPPPEAFTVEERERIRFRGPTHRTGPTASSG